MMLPVREVIVPNSSWFFCLGLCFLNVRKVVGDTQNDLRVLYVQTIGL